MSAKRVTAIGVLFLTVGVGNSLADTNVGGLICNDTTWTPAGNPYLVTSSIVIGCNATLTIQPGVEVRFNAGLGIIVGSSPQQFGPGTLKALGSEASPITFKSNVSPQNPGAWSRIYFTDYAVDADLPGDVYASGSKLEWVIVEYAGAGGLAAITIEKSRPYLNHCNVHHGAGQGISIDGSSAPPQRIDNSEVWECRPSGVSGGGIFLTGGSGHRLAGNSVHDCSVSWGYSGGGIYLGAQGTLEDNAVANNSAYHGGGLFLTSAGGSTLRRNTVRDNTASYYGGGMHLSSSGSPLTENTIRGNSSTLGGGMYFGSSASTLTGNTIAENTASQSGGGIYFGSSGSTLTGNTITDNITSDHGGGIYFASSTSTLNGNTIADNLASDNGGGLYFSSSANSSLSSNTITGNTCGGVGGAIMFDGSGNSQVTDTEIIGNHTTGGSCGGIYVTNSPGVSLRGDPDPLISNTIHDNDACDVQNANAFNANGSNDVDARYVDWGPGDAKAIQEEVCDFFDDAGRAVVLLSLDSADINGLICDDTTWTLAESPYTVTTSVLVGCGATLTVAPDVVIRFDPCLGIVVGSAPFGTGELVARGTPDSPIVFTSNVSPQNPGAWSRIYFTDYAVDADLLGNLYAGGSIVEHAIVEYAGCGGVAAVTIEKSRPYLNHCNLHHGAGQGISIDGSSAPPQRIDNSEVWEFHPSNANGGGIVLTGGSGHHLAGNSVHDCSVSWGYSGGGIYLGAQGTLEDNAIANNSAYHGGGLFLTSAGSSTLRRNTVRDNTASYYGGGMHLSSSGSPLTENTIRGNSSTLGGGMYFGSSASTLTGNTIAENTASQSGGGIYFGSSGSTLTGNTITDNITSDHGGGIYFASSTSTLNGNTIADNLASDNGGGVYFASSANSRLSGDTINGNTCGGVGGAIVFDASGSSQVTDTEVIGNHTNAGSCGGIYVTNSPGVSLRGDPASCIINRICDNDECDVQNANAFTANGSNDVDARNVWWCTCDINQIQEMICDFFDDASKAFVLFFPIAEPGSDADWDCDVDLVDFKAFQDESCMTGPCSPACDPALQAACAVFDVDCDGDIDLADLAQWQNAFTGP